MKTALLAVVCLVLVACGSEGGNVNAVSGQNIEPLKPVYGYRENVPVRSEFLTLFEKLNVTTAVKVRGVISLYSYPCLLQFLVDGEVKQEVTISTFYHFNLDLLPGAFEIRVKSLNPTSYIKPCETYMLVDLGSEPRP